MIHLGTQYYRPPFPNQKYWEDDIQQMADSGLNTIQLWVVWAWVEAEPGTFRFDDYDRLVELAGKHGLEVVLSTIAAIHPYWIHREVPGSHMVDNFGHDVVSSNRGEVHFGLTPGGCFDHPGIWERMKTFLETVVTHYRETPHLFGWDAWNELRWNVQADGLVCYCDHTINRFRTWLSDKYGGLDGLNEAWQRRYTSWKDVRPGKMPNRPYTEMMAFQDFITWRAVQHAYDRYRVIKTIDPHRPVTVHGAQPTVLHGTDSYPNATALHRGNDWSFAEEIDGIGCSSFPKWGGLEMDRAQFINRLDYVASARQGKRFWLSELQGGRSNIGFNVAQSVDPAAQQSWVWTGISAGADTILFWCWRDEVFGRESTGFGLAGSDGLAPERLAAMQTTGEILKAYGDFLATYEPTPAEVGILFSPQSYYLYWAQDGTAVKPLAGIQGYARALVRQNIPYRIVEEEHLDQLKGLKLLILPRVNVMAPEVAERLAGFVRGGGMLFCESEVGAFGTDGIYRYPEERFFAELTGAWEVGRRQLSPSETVTLEVAGETHELRAAQWLTPLMTSHAHNGEPQVLKSVQVGDGRVLLCGTYLGDAYLEAGDLTRGMAFEDFVGALTREAGVTCPVTVRGLVADAENFVHVRSGSDGERSVVFVFTSNPEATVALHVPAGTFGEKVRDIISGHEIDVIADDDVQQVMLGPTDWGISVLVG